MKRKEAIELYSVLRELKNGSISRDGIKSLILTRIKLKPVFDEFESVKKEISEQTKPESFKEGDSTAEWEKEFQSVISEWLNEDSGVSGLSLMSIDDFSELVSANDMIGAAQDLLYQNIVKE